MRSRSLLIFYIILLSVPVFSQSPDWDQRVAFSEQVKKIRYWAYIADDPYYKCYTEAVSAIEATLNRKGYDSQRLFYEAGDSLPVAAWKKKQINSLASDEAFLEIRVKVHADSGLYSDANTMMVQDASGRVYAQHKLNPSENKGVAYSATATACLYIAGPADKTDAATPFYLRSSRVSNPDAGDAASTSLKGIPGSRHPVTVKKPAYLNKGGVTIFEFAVYGGYCAGGTISIDGGKAIYQPGADYGIEFKLNIYKGLDFGIGYKREDTFARIDALNYPREGDLPLSNNYILLSGAYRFLRKGNLQPFIGFDFGGVNVVMKDVLFRDVWYFAMGGRAGACWYVTRVLGFRLQTQLLYQIPSKEAPFLYTDDIWKMRYPINANSNLAQFDVTIGILIRLGKI